MAREAAPTPVTHGLRVQRARSCAAELILADLDTLAPVLRSRRASAAAASATPPDRRRRTGADCGRDTALGIGHTVPMTDRADAAPCACAPASPCSSRLTALVASLGLAVVTYAVARTFLIDQRTTTAQTQAFTNAKTVRDQLRRRPSNVRRPGSSLRTESERLPVLLVAGTDGRSRPDTRYPGRRVPAELIALRRPGQQRHAAVRVRRRARTWRSASTCRQSTRSTSRHSRWTTPSATCAPSPPRSAIGSGVDDRCSPASSAGGPAAVCCDRSPASPRPPARSPPAVSTPACRRRATPTSTGWPARSTTWPTRCRPGSNARPASRQRRQPRAALADHRAHRRGRGARRPAHRPARPHPAGARRGGQPGSPLRSDGDGPARAVAHRRRLHRAAPRGGRRRAS